MEGNQESGISFVCKEGYQFVDGNIVHDNFQWALVLFFREGQTIDEVKYSKSDVDALKSFYETDKVFDVVFDVVRRLNNLNESRLMLLGEENGTEQKESLAMAEASADNLDNVSF